MPTTDHQGPVLYFDGVCNLCNRTVQWVIKHDRKKIFRFAPLQSAAGIRLQQETVIQASRSVLLAYNGLVYSKSTAALNVMRLLGGLPALLYVFIIIPRFLRDGIYNIVARNRYKWFGQQASCMIPTPELRGRFLE